MPEYTGMGPKPFLCGHVDCYRVRDNELEAAKRTKFEELQTFREAVLLAVGEVKWFGIGSLDRLTRIRDSLATATATAHEQQRNLTSQGRLGAGYSWADFESFVRRVEIQTGALAGLVEELGAAIDAAMPTRVSQPVPAAARRTR